MVSRARAVETDRVADEDRRASVARSKHLTSLVAKQRREFDVLALAVLLLLVAAIVGGFLLSLR